MITFAYPFFLILLPLIILIFYFDRHSLSDLPPFRRIASLTLRCIIFILLVLSLAGIKWVKSSNQLTVIYLVDLSDSIREESEQFAKSFINLSMQHKLGEDMTGVVIFGRNTLVEYPPTVDLNVTTPFKSKPIRTGTNIAEAIRLAMGLFPPDSQKRMVIISDGNQTEGDMLQEAVLAETNQVEIDVIPLQIDINQEVLISDVISPRIVKEGEPFEVRVVLQSSAKTSGKLWLYRDGNPISEPIPVDIDAGKNIYRFTETLDESGLYTYDARLETDQDEIIENNRAGSFSQVKGKSRLLLVNPSRSLQEVLLPLRETVQVEIANIAQIPAHPAQLQQYDAIVLNDVPAMLLSDVQMKLLQSYVRDFGGGLTMIGGENSFGVGGYYQTPVEQALPVDMDLKSKKYFPSLAIAFAIDKSGSMSMTSGGVTKIDLAKEATIAAISLLSDKDYVGVVGFDGAAKWVVNMQLAKHRKKLRRDVGALRAGGGTNLYPALVEALSALNKVDAQLKHIIVLSDGRTSPGNFAAFLEEAEKSKVTLSTVAIGKDADIQLMEHLAQKGRGRSYITHNPNRIPQIFTKETILASKSYLIEEPFTPQQIQDHVLLKGIPTSLPPLQGYVATSAKPTSEILWISHKEDPVLAVWQYGLGRSVAFTSDADSRWAVSWLSWDHFGQYWRQALRWSMRRVSSSSLQTRINIQDLEGQVMIDAIDDDGNFRNFLELEGVVLTPDLQSKPVQIRQTAPGRYEGRFDADKIGTYLVNLYAKNEVGSEIAGVTVSYSQEYQRFTDQSDVLLQTAAITGGERLASPQDVFRHNMQDVSILTDIWELLMKVAIVLFFLDIALRRLLIDWSQFTPVLAKVKALKKQITPSTPIQLPTSDRLTTLIRRKTDLQEQSYQTQPTEMDDNSVEKKDIPTKTYINPAINREIGEEEEKRDQKNDEMDTADDYTQRLLNAKKRARRQN